METKRNDVLTVLAIVVAALTLGGMETNNPIGKALIGYWVVVGICFLTFFFSFILPTYRAAKKDKERLGFDPRCVIDGTPGRHSGLRRK